MALLKRLSFLFLLFFVFPSLAGAEKNPVSPIALGLNIWGRPGLFVEDTSRTFPRGSFSWVGSFVYEFFSGERDTFLIPLGMNVGVTDDFNLYANGQFQSNVFKTPGFSSLNGINRVMVGGIYVFKDTLKNLDTSLALDVSIGSLNSALGSYTTDFNPKFAATYVLDNRLLLTSELTVYLPGTPYPTYMQVSLGAAYTFFPSLDGIVEFLHHTMGGQTEPGTIGVVGIRTAGRVQFQGFVGTQVASAYAPNLFTGFSIVVNSR